MTARLSLDARRQISELNREMKWEEDMLFMQNDGRLKW